MSLVVCSNKEQDGVTSRQDQSIYSPWSFRNQLPSTMTIPANAQVALQSCKINVDGRVVFSRNNHQFYNWFGEKLNLDGITDPQMADTTSHPALTRLTNSNEKNTVVELSLDDFAVRLQESIENATYHPNVKRKTKVEVLRNGSSLDFLGYKIIKDQSLPTTNLIPATNAFTNYFSSETPADVFSYTAGVFQRITTNELEDVCGIAKALPLSLNNGSFVVDINGSNANVNASGVEWTVGLSRSVNRSNDNDLYRPSYNNSDDNQPRLLLDENCFMDFGVSRNRDGELVVQHTCHDPTLGEQIRKYEIQYWDNGNSIFNGDSGRHVFAVTSPYTKVGFFTEGEQMTAKLYNSDPVDPAKPAGAKIGWQIICSYDGADANTFFKPINQSCWCLHPVLCIGEDGTNASCKMEIEEYTAVALTDYDATVKNKGGWFETLEILGTANRYCKELESRSWNDPGSSLYVQKGLNGSGGTNLQHVLVLEQSDIYTPSLGANAKQLFGFNNSVVDTPVSFNGNQYIFESTFTPDLTSSQAMFIRLNNFGQNVHNAFAGNRSKIISHLPRFDNSQSTGRLYFEPKNFVWLDLGNSAPLNINEFDLSFCYVNEQYATVLTGQSIVCLYFRAAPKE
tara:strand:- start:2651 stop:4522 length:1872 start_codon:yes stop_codon:yes gene_type:complete